MSNVETKIQAEVDTNNRAGEAVPRFVEGLQSDLILPGESGGTVWVSCESRPTPINLPVTDVKHVEVRTDICMSHY